MTTRRSRNKLERKAHTSIHDTLEVTDPSREEPSWTRDRFGKKQGIETNEEEA